MCSLTRVLLLECVVLSNVSIGYIPYIECVLLLECVPGGSPFKCQYRLYTIVNCTMYYILNAICHILYIECVLLLECVPGGSPFNVSTY